MPAYPFVKNFSSRESAFYINDAMIFSPMELYLGLMFFGWLGKNILINRQTRFYKSELSTPLLAFSFFLLVGLAYGIGTGGDINTALWEVRPIFYMILTAILASNLIEKREHINHILWIAMIAIWLDGMIGMYTLFVVHNGNMSAIDRIQEHSASIHANTLFIFTIAVWVYRASWQKRLLLPFMIPPVLLTYLANQRRAAFLTLAIAIFLIFVIVRYEYPKLFKLITPTLTILFGLYLLVFWNIGGPVGMPAQAIKSIVADSSVNVEDQRSNEYRTPRKYQHELHDPPLSHYGHWLWAKILPYRPLA